MDSSIMRYRLWQLGPVDHCFQMIVIQRHLPVITLFLSVFTPRHSYLQKWGDTELVCNYMSAMIPHQMEHKVYYREAFNYYDDKNEGKIIT